MSDHKTQRSRLVCSELVTRSSIRPLLLYIGAMVPRTDPSAEALLQQTQASINNCRAMIAEHNKEIQRLNVVSAGDRTWVGEGSSDVQQQLRDELTKKLDVERMLRGFQNERRRLELELLKQRAGQDKAKWWRFSYSDMPRRQ